MLTNTSYVIIYAMLALAASVFCVISLRPQNGGRANAPLAMMAGSAVLWTGCIAAFYLIADTRIALFVHEMKFIGVCMSTVALLLYTLRHIRANRLLDNATVGMASIIPLITVILAITNSYHGLFRQSMQVVDGPIRTLRIENGLWFYVHSVYSVLLLTCAALLSFRAFFRTPRSLRWALGVLGGTICMILLVSVQSMGRPRPWDLDITPIAVVVSLPFLHWAMGTVRQSDYIVLAREEAFNSLESANFILDARGQIVDCNRAAQAFCADMELGRIERMTLDDFMGSLNERGGVLSQSVVGKGKDLRLCIQGRDCAFAIHQRAFIDADGRRLGSFVTLTDETENRQLIEKLEKNAETDALTGLFNRLEYEQALERLDQPENLPVSVIIGDVNNLKQVNDSFGHEEGDNLLRAAGELLTSCAPQGSTVARIGGDEFIILVTHTPHQQALSIIDRIRAAALRKTGKPYPLSIALGCATKASPQENIKALIDTADREMYSDKRNDRRCRG